MPRQPARQGDLTTSVEEWLQTLYHKASSGHYAVVRIPREEDQAAAWTSVDRTYYAVVNGIPRLPTITRDDKTKYAYFYTPAVLQEQSTRQEAVKEVTALWVDFDEPETTEQLLNRLSPRPSALITSSGHGRRHKHHAYWLLRDPVAPVHVQPILRWMAHQYRADVAVSNANRLLRLPDTWNYKTGTTPCEVVHYHPTLTYELSDFGSLGDSSVDGRTDAGVSIANDLIPLGGDGLSRTDILLKYERRMPARLRRLLEHPITHMEGASNRHGALASMYRMCRQLDMTPEECYWLIKDTPNDKWHTDKVYRPDEALRRDILWVYGQDAELGGQSVLDEILEIRAEAKTRDPMTGKLIKEAPNVTWEKIAGVIIRDLESRGEFIQTARPLKQYYLQQGETTVVEVQDRDPYFQKMLLDTYKIEPTSVEYKSLAIRLQSHAMDEPFVEVHRQGYFDEQRRNLYVNLFDQTMLKLDGRSITPMPNGSEGVFFINPPSARPWTYTPGATASGWSSLVYSAANISATNNLQRADVEHVIHTWVLATFLGNIIPVKPILYMRGDPGSGKTSIFKNILTALYGGSVPTTVPKTSEDYYLAAWSNPLFILDNVDSYFPWLPEALESTATGTSYTKRTLYKDDVTNERTISTFIGLTAATPRGLSRTALVQRMIPVDLDRWGGTDRPYISEKNVTDQVLLHRNELLSALVRELNQLVNLWKTRGMPDGAAQVRFADFAGILRDTCDHAAVNYAKCIDFITGEQTRNIVDDDPLAQVLVEFVQGRSETERMTAARLHLHLSVCASGDLYKKVVTSGRALVQQLRILKPALEQMGIYYTQFTGDPMTYQFVNHKKEVTETWSPKSSGSSATRGGVIRVIQK